MAHDTPMSQRAADQQARVWREEVEPRLIAENAARPPVACWCGRGVVTSIHGCDACHREESARYWSALMGRPDLTGSSQL